MKCLFSAVLSLLLINAVGQVQWGISAGTTRSIAKYDNSYSGLIKTNAGSSWALEVSNHLPLAKKLTLVNGLSYYNKKFNYSTPGIADAYVDETARCSYLQLKTAIHFDVIHKRSFLLSAGAGFFGAVGAGGKYNRFESFFTGSRTSAGKVQYGNTAADNFKPFDAGVSLQLIARYKNFFIPVSADISCIPNLPPDGSARRKWQSWYAGMGYSFPLQSKK